MSSVKHMFYKYVESNILSYKLSQDHLEVFFSNIRAMGGFCPNPNAMHFESAYKKLLLHNEVKESAPSNCVSQLSTNILTVSSRKHKNIQNEDVLAPNDDITSIIDDIPLTYLHPLLDHAVNYISGFVEYKVKKILKCSNCITFLENCEKNK